MTMNGDGAATDGGGKGRAAVAPQLLSGFRDFLPKEMLLRQRVLDILREVFERHGYEPLDTPALEYAATLTGKYGEDEKLLYRFTDHGGREVGLRYDLTVPLARVAAQHANDLVLPFKRYHIAPVWRGDRPQRGRFREFYQCDVDTVGSPSMLADAESVATVAEALARLGFPEFTIQINHRGIIKGLALLAGVAPERAGQVYRSVDKIEKIGAEGVRAELIERGVAPEAAERVLGLVTLGGADDEILAELRVRAAGLGEMLDGVADLERLLGHLAALGVPRERYALRLSMVRGLDYYTGPVFEIATDRPKVGSIGGGGRYDRLIGSFSGRDVPASGFSLGLERIFEVIREHALLPEARSVAQILVAIVRERGGGHEAGGDDGTGAALALVRELREAAPWVRAEVYLNERRGLPDQFKYADRKGVPLVALAGLDERARGVVKLRDLRSGEERAVPRAALAETVREMLAGA
ncbi:MAG: Histidyl-tRNA synthetase [uncultured Thermomicrobiales bacterium]|uniref:Histidine--tRNA ligase n=1 Tax=uncultured Thermomicrobiales bacterium TaxID=1645740 RepID=A0A6J4V1S9_9BACT|nr:MAG: Histidyl-tRNA synthetase [uncultured Thermomicrobiales bacterium]